MNLTTEMPRSQLAEVGKVEVELTSAAEDGQKVALYELWRNKTCVVLFLRCSGIMKRKSVRAGASLQGHESSI